LSVQLRCPACGKENIAGPGDACRRCGCDLGRICEVRQAAAHSLQAAARLLRGGNWEAALGAAERSWRLRHSPEAARLAFLAAAALGNTSGAEGWSDAARRLEDDGAGS
jgi:hypothetical protein